MIAFSKDIDERTMKKEQYDEGWNDLADKLNELGPPIRDSWGRLWSVYGLHNQKRKQPAIKQSAVERRSCPDLPQNVRPLDRIATSSPLSEQIGPANTQSAVKRRSCPDRSINVRPLDRIATSSTTLSEQIGPANTESVKHRSCPDVRPLDPIATPLSEQLVPQNVRPLDRIATSSSPLSEQIGPANTQSAVKRRSCPDLPQNVRPLIESLQVAHHCQNKCVRLTDLSTQNTVDKRAKTNRNQFNLMIAFSKDIDERTMKKEQYDEGWNDLADKLNRLGPPIRDSWGWRRVWSVYKANQKRKQPAIRQSAVKRRSCPDLPQNVRPLDRIATSSSPLSEQMCPANTPRVVHLILDLPQNVRTNRSG